MSLIGSIVVTVISVIALIGIWHIIEHKQELKTRISFRETMNLTDLPIITFYNNGRKLNFILDTGSNRSVLNIRELGNCVYQKLNSTNELLGMDGIPREVENISLILSYNKREYAEVFQAVDISSALDGYKKESGVNVHGILGNTFFLKYRYILDFNDLVAYQK